MQKVALVTGANKGIGFEVSRQLGRAGFIVLMGARDTTQGEKAASTLRAEGLDARAVQVDLLRADNDGVALAKAVAQEFGSLDVLVNNAAILDGQDGLPGTVPSDVVRKTFETNFVGTVAFTQPFVPLLRAANHGRIVNVSSGIGSLAVNGNPNPPAPAPQYLAYSASKAAVNMFTVQLAYELRETSVKVNSACPGFVATDMNHHTGTDTVEMGSVEILRLAQLPEDGPTGGFFNREYGALPW